MGWRERGRRIALPMLLLSVLLHLLLMATLWLAHRPPPEGAVAPPSFEMLTQPEVPIGKPNAATPSEIPAPAEPPAPAAPPVPTPPSATPPVPAPPVPTPPTTLPPSAAPPTAMPPTAMPPSATPPSVTPPSATPPSATPLTATPPSATPPTASPPAAAVPTTTVPPGPSAPPRPRPAQTSALPPSATGEIATPPPLATPHLPLASPPAATMILPPAVPVPPPPAPPAAKPELPQVRLSLMPEMPMPPEDEPSLLRPPPPPAPPSPRRRPVFPMPMDTSLGPSTMPSQSRAASRGTGAIDLRLGRAAQVSNGEPPRDSAAAVGSIVVHGAQVGKDWIELLHEWWLRHGYYPQEAARRGEDGLVAIHVKVDRYGIVHGVELLSSSGSQWLDLGAQGTFRGAHLPPFPPSTPEPDADLDITIQYVLTGR